MNSQKVSKKSKLSSKRFLFGSREKHLLFDLKKTIFMLKSVTRVLKTVHDNKGLILFYIQDATIVKICDLVLPKKPNLIYFSKSWVSGSLTNWAKIYPNSNSFPSLFIILGSTSKEVPLVEALQIGIPSIAFSDNFKEKFITYPIPIDNQNIKIHYIIIKLFETILKTSLYSSVV